MITDTDIKKMKAVFATKEDLDKMKAVFATKDEMNNGFLKIIDFIGEIKSDIMKELNEFRNEVRDINRSNQSTLNNHEARIAHLEL